tara:strand:+ start:172 stop:1239 length:1068 start_codon:yes stop_codon:yes gene_type:complete
MKKLLKKIISISSKKKSIPIFKLSKPLKIGITGAGSQGTQLCNLAKNYGAKIVAVHDANIDAAKKLANIHNAKVSTTDFDKFFEEPMDGLLISTLPTIRLEPITRACNKNINIFVEKPPAYNLIEARKCLSAIKKSNIISSVGFQLRYDPRYKKVKELIADNEIHLVRTKITIDYYLNYRMSPWFLEKQISGGPIAEQAIHMLDCVRFVFNNTKALQAVAIGTKNMGRYNKNFDAENAMQLMYKLDNGIIGVHTNHCGQEKPRFDLELIGPNFQLEANATESKIHGIINGREVNENPSIQNDNGLDKISSWLKAIETKDITYLTSSYEDSLYTQSLVDAAIKSQTTHRVETVETV